MKDWNITAAIVLLNFMYETVVHEAGIRAAHGAGDGAAHIAGNEPCAEWPTEPYTALT